MYHYRISTDEGNGLQKRRLYIYGLGAAALILLMVMGIWASSANVGAVTVNNGTGKQATKVVPPQTYNGKYFSFTYPGGYIRDTRNSLSSALESATFSGDTSYPSTISVSVTNLPAGGLTQDADYNYRKTFTNLYSERNYELSNGDVAVVMMRSDGTEQTAFIVHNDYLAVLSFSDSGTNDSIMLGPDINQALASFTWH